MCSEVFGLPKCSGDKNQTIYRSYVRSYTYVLSRLTMRLWHVLLMSCVRNMDVLYHARSCIFQMVVAVVRRWAESRLPFIVYPLHEGHSSNVCKTNHHYLLVWFYYHTHVLSTQLSYVVPSVLLLCTFDGVCKCTYKHQQNVTSSTANRKKGVVYSIPCAECPCTYIGQTGRSLDHRLCEHCWALKNGPRVLCSC